jgi:hypothetical protein
MRLRMSELNRSEPLHFVWSTPAASALAVQAALNWVESNEDALAPSFSADFDGDLDVDGADFLVWQRNLGATNALQINGDANRDRAIDGADLAVWRDEAGTNLASFPGAQSSAGIAANVPEPGGGVMALLSVIGAIVAARSVRH